MNPDLDQYYSLSGTKRDEFRKNEIEQLAQKIKSLTSGTFSDIRDKEITRLEPYYHAFARVFNIDLRSVAITRIQQMATTMLSSIILIQSLFDENPTDSQQGLTFFDSRREAGGIGFNANSEVRIAGKTMVFSVVKRQFSDSEGAFEVDLPAYSLPREVFSLLQKWHKDAYGVKPFDDNPLLSLASELISRRVHDWIHQAILYDTQAVTKAFQTWSDNSFFVKHIFDDPGMINYELLSNHLHYRVWQELFIQDPEAKVQVIHDLAHYYELITDFCRWMKNEKVTSGDDANATADFLAYIGTRGIFDVMRFDDPLLTKELGEDKILFKKVLRKLLPQKYIPYLQSVYDHDKNLPFRKGSDRTLSIQHILEEYLTGLREEAATTKNKSVLQALLLDKPRHGHVPLAKEFSSLPNELQSHYAQIDITEIDPRVFQYLNALFQRLQKSAGSNLIKILLKDIEVDISGYLYLKIDRDEPDFPYASEVLQQKGALLVQIPYDETTDHTLTVERMSNLLHSQTGAQAIAKPGDVILVNTQDENLAQDLIKKISKKKKR
ncbi:MAG: hypothetical protein UZ21_OP11001000321 [Microgenomates bacterium OLB22]|nr:MAG: hypothetical protein UZ21_OP11001000321 [Microgenomates bacterium OLB22]